MWGFIKIRGTLFRGPYNKDYSILGSILGFPYFGKLPCWGVLTLGAFDSELWGCKVQAV